MNAKGSRWNAAAQALLAVSLSAIVRKSLGGKALDASLILSSEPRVIGSNPIGCTSDIR